MELRIVILLYFIAGIAAEESDHSETEEVRPFMKRIEAYIKEANLPVDPNIQLSLQTRANCLKNEECDVDAAAEQLGSRLAKNCLSNNSTEQDTVVVVLKSFGNLGFMGSYIDAILECVDNTALPTPIRLAAIESFRRTSLSDNAIDIFLQIMVDRGQLVEMRIASYLALHNYLNQEILDKITIVLDEEIKNQVNVFIWTHIQNLKDTKDPLKQLLLDAYRINKFHNIQPQTFSRNYVLTIPPTMADESAENAPSIGQERVGNVIYTGKSYIPVSASLNFSINVDGSCIEIFEVEVRTEHFEQQVAEAFNFLAKKNESADEEAGEEAEGSVSLKFFGDVVMYHTFHNLKDMISKNGGYQKIVKVTQQIYKDFNPYERIGTTFGSDFATGMHRIFFQ